MSHIDEGELTAYADGAYAPDSADAQRIREHLATCANCRNRLAEAQTLSARASELLEIAAPAGITVPDFEALRARAGARPRTRAIVPLSWAATVVLALGLGWLGRGWYAPRPVERTAAPDANVAVAPATRVQPQAAAPAKAAPPALAPAAPAQPAGQPLGVTDFARPEPASVSAERAAVAAPPPAAPAPTVGERDFSGLGRASATTEYITVAEAERRGIQLHIIPELEVLRVGLRPDTVVIEQKLADARVITITQTAAAVSLDAVVVTGAAQKVAAQLPPTANQQRAPMLPSEERARVADMKHESQGVVVMRAGTRLQVTAPVPVDSLRAFAARIR